MEVRPDRAPRARDARRGEPADDGRPEPEPPLRPAGGSPGRRPPPEESLVGGGPIVGRLRTEGDLPRLQSTPAPSKQPEIIRRASRHSSCFADRDCLLKMTSRNTSVTIAFFAMCQRGVHLEPVQ